MENIMSTDLMTVFKHTYLPYNLALLNKEQTFFVFLKCKSSD